MILIPVPPSNPSLSTSNHTWLENRTYIVICESKAGNPESSYRWSLDGQEIKDEHSNQIQIQAHMDLNKALLGCNVSNNYTISKNTPKYDTRNLIVQC